jgi:hypothetical protein
MPPLTQIVSVWRLLAASPPAAALGRFIWSCSVDPRALIHPNAQKKVFSGYRLRLLLASTYAASVIASAYREAH